MTDRDLPSFTPSYVPFILQTRTESVGGEVLERRKSLASDELINDNNILTKMKLNKIKLK